MHRILRDSEKSRYFIDDTESSADAYIKRLEEENILVNAQNFLVFQNKVQEIADRKPGALTALIEQVSGSKELEADYNEKKRIKESLESVSTEAFGRRKTIAIEMKQYKEQLDEAHRYEQLDSEKVRPPR